MKKTMLEVVQKFVREVRLEVTVDPMSPQELAVWNEEEGVILDRNESVFVKVAKAKSSSGETAYYAVLTDTSQDDGSKQYIREEGLGLKYHLLPVIEAAVAAVLRERSKYASQILLSDEILDEVISEEE